MPRDFSGGQARPRVPGKDFEYDPLLVALCSHHVDRTADLQAGQAMQRMLLTATSLGLVASLFPQVVEVSETWEELRGLLGGSLHPPRADPPRLRQSRIRGPAQGSARPRARSRVKRRRRDPRRG